MKTLKFTLLFLLVSLFTACEKQTPISPEQTSSDIQTYLSLHFPDKTIVQNIKEFDDLATTYEILLNDYTRLEFNRNFAVQEIESNSKLPDSVIPVSILEYVNSNFPAQYIVAWKLEDRHQQIELNNDLEIEFEMDGRFRRIDP